MHKILMAIIAIFYTGLVQAQPLLTVEEAVAIALENNYNIRIAENDASIAGNNVSHGNAGFLPNVYLVATQNNTLTDTRQQLLSGDEIVRNGAQSHTFNSGAVLNWTVFDGLRMFTTLDRLREMQLQGETAARAVIESTVSQIISAYYLVVVEQQQLSVLEENVSVSEEREELVRQNYEIGTASRLNLLQAQVDLNADRSALLRQEEVLLNARVSLNELLARAVNTEFTVVDSIPLMATLSREVVMEQAKMQNPELRLAQLDERIAGLQLREHNAARWPQIGVNLGYNYNYLTSETGVLMSNQSLGWNYGISAVIPIFNGFNHNRERQNFKIRQETAQIQLDAMETKLEAAVEQVHVSYINNLVQVQLEEENIGISMDNLDIAQERYRIGTLTALELRDAQSNYILARSRYIGAVYRAKTAETELLRLSGRISQ